MKIFSGNVAERLRSLNDGAEAIVVGAGAGLSTAAGFTYSGERFERYFRDFRERYGIRDMYSGGFYPFPDAETFWGWWCRHIWVNRYAPLPGTLYARNDIVNIRVVGLAQDDAAQDPPGRQLRHGEEDALVRD